MRRLCVGFFSLALCVLPIAAANVLAATAEKQAVVNLSDYKGQVVVLDFWASWCGPCRDSFPWLNAMQKKYADKGLVIIGVNVDAERSDAEAFLEKYPAEFQVVYDAEGTLATQYEIVGMPSSVVLGRNGKVISQHHGFKNKYVAKYEDAFRRALTSINQPGEL